MKRISPLAQMDRGEAYLNNGINAALVKSGAFVFLGIL
jgi:hypothetical protein